jgi:histidinol-phosphate aminotransferase
MGTENLKSSDITALIRPDIAALEPYTPIVPFDILSARLGRDPKSIIKLDANENPYGPGPRVREALAHLEYPHIYPDPESTALRTALARDTGVPAANLLAGAGADELIDLIMRLFLQPGDGVLDCPPTFGMYAFDAAVNAARVIKVPRHSDFGVDVAAIEKVVAASAATTVKIKLLFLASPNNPDGSVITNSDLHRLLNLPLVVVLDEAYVDFHGMSRARWVLDFDNLIILRTFSKRAGLAGLRVGFGAFPSVLMPHLWKIKQPYNVSVAASVAAMAALEDEEHTARVIGLLIAERERLRHELAAIQYLQPFPSRANFILCRVTGRDARDVKVLLEQKGILVRHFNKPGLTDCIRLSVGRPEHTDALLEALRSI